MKGPSFAPGDYRDAVAVTPHDTNQITPCRGLWIGGAGAVRVLTVAGTDILLSGCTAGSILPMQVKQVFSTSTTATLIRALY